MVQKISVMIFFVLGAIFLSAAVAEQMYLDNVYGPELAKQMIMMQQQQQQQEQEPKHFDVLKAKTIRSNDDLSKVNTTYAWQTTWPKQKKILGDVSAVAFDVDNNVVCFHRGDRVWNQETFSIDNVYQESALGPIAYDTIAAFNHDDGHLVYEFGKNTFYMPHGLSIDQNNNFWITDVALHQVMKFSGKTTEKRADLILGVPFQPGNSLAKFCKPTAVAVLPNGDFFVSDGYCNSRIMKFSANGQYLLHWGRNSFQGNSFKFAPENFFAIPHALTLALDKGLVCVADRENGRVQCFHVGNGTFHSQYYSPLIGDRLFGVSYTPIRGGQLVVINGMLPVPNYSLQRDEKKTRILGFVMDMTTKKVISKFGPGNKEFNSSHDVIVSPDGTEIYVAVLSPNRVYKFKSTDLTLYNQSALHTNPTIKTDADSVTPIKIPMNPVDSGATALLIVSIIVLILILIFGLALLITKRKRKGNLSDQDLEYSKLMPKHSTDE